MTLEPDPPATIADQGAYCPWVRFAGHARRPGAWWLPDRYTFDYFLATTSSGEEWLEIDGQRIIVPEGHGYIVPPGTVFSRGAEDGSHTWFVHADLAYGAQREQVPLNHRHVGVVGDHAVELTQPGPQRIFGCDLPILLPETLRPRLFGLVRGMVLTWQDEGEQRLKINATLATFFAVLVEHLRSQRAGDEDLEQRIRRAELVVARSIGDDVDVRTFAAAAGLKPSRFHEVYRELRGITPHRYIKDRRMLRARDLLRDPSLSIGTVASLVGHPDSTVFARIFRQEHGCTPGEWRERYLRELDDSGGSAGSPVS